MFRFTLSDKFRKQGISPEAISSDMRNRFDAQFGGEGNPSKLDGRFQVRVNETVIRFFYYTGEMSEVMIEDKYKEVASISLSNVKETGQDILFFNRQVKEKVSNISSDIVDEIKLYSKSLVGYSDDDRDRRQYRLFGFPFVNSFPPFVNIIQVVKKTKFDKKDIGEKDKEWFVFFMQCCFLYFILDFENRGCDFHMTTFYEDVRAKLHKSDVYKLLYAKTKYTIRCYEGEAPMSEEDYTFVTRNFANRLMDKNLNKVIPSDYYSKSMWFYNPEIELDLIVKRIPSKRSNRKRGNAILDVELQHKIRDFFFTKQAVVSAMGESWRKKLYWFYIIVLGGFSIVATRCLLHFDEDLPLANWFFDSMRSWGWICMGAFIVIVNLILSITNKSLNVIMPRALVALSIGWLTTFISDDLIKSQVKIDVFTTKITFIGVLILIIILLIGESGRYSPYYLGRHVLRFPFWKQIKYPSSWKFIPILVHSYFWALVFGVIMQFTFYEDLLRNSKALPEIVYEDTLEKTVTYIMYLENYKDVLASYKNDWNTIYSTSIRTKGSSIGKDFNKITLYSDPEFSFYEEHFRQQIEDVFVKYNAIRKYRFEIWNDWENSTDKVRYKMNVSLKDFDFNKLEYGSSHMLAAFQFKNELLDFLNSVQNNKLSVKDKFKNITDQLLYLEKQISQTEEEIRYTNLFISNNKNWDTLITWSDYRPENCIGLPKNVQECMKLNAIVDHNLCRVFGKKRIYPRMLVFHSLIVLIIAFVGQIIISDKSVTEPF